MSKKKKQELIEITELEEQAPELTDLEPELDSENQVIADDALIPQVYTNNEVNDLREELATAILGRLQDVDSLQLRFIQSGLTPKEKLDALIQFKTCMVIPALRLSLGLPTNTQEIDGTYAVIKILESIEESILSVINYEDNEVIDFSHPKIVESYRMLFEILIDVLTEEIKDPITINNFIEKAATRCVNIEAEFNKAFKKLSNRMASYAQNPVTQPFAKRNTDPIIAKLRLIQELDRAKNILTEMPELVEWKTQLEQSVQQDKQNAIQEAKGE